MKRKLYETKSTGSVVLDRLRDKLIGAFCYGDDGENAEITNVYFLKGVPVIDIQQEDGIFFAGLELAGYLDAIVLEDDDREEIEDYLESLGIYESGFSNPKRKLILNEEVTRPKPKKGVAVILDSEDSASVMNFVSWSRELLKEVGIPVTDPKAERVFIKEGNIYYQSPFIGGFKPGKAKMLQARLQKYINREGFPEGMELVADRGMFIAIFDTSGEIKLGI